MGHKDRSCGDVHNGHSKNSRRGCPKRWPKRRYFGNECEPNVWNFKLLRRVLNKDWYANESRLIYYFLCFSQRTVGGTSCAFANKHSAVQPSTEHGLKRLLAFSSSSSPPKMTYVKFPCCSLRHIRLNDSGELIYEAPLSLSVLCFFESAYTVCVVVQLSNRYLLARLLCET
jgi:hypothetical protein